MEDRPSSGLNVVGFLVSKYSHQLIYEECLEVLFFRTFRRFCHNESGSALAYTAIMLPALIGFMGMGIDVAIWQIAKRETQLIADAAALAGAVEIVRSRTDGDGTAPNFHQAIIRDAKLNGFKDSAGDTLNHYWPPQSGKMIDNEDAVEVTVRRKVDTLFAHLFLDGQRFVSSRAVALGDVSDTCLWALDPDEYGSLRVSGAADVSFNCGIFANSVAVEAIQVDGKKACLRGSEVEIVGGADGSCIEPTPTQGVQPRLDPLNPLPLPELTGCDYTSKITINSGDTVTLYPGTYCDDIDIRGGNVTFAPGVFALDRAALSISAQATVTGDNVTFYISPNGDSNDNISVSGGATVDLNAPTSGIYRGLLFVQDPDSSENITHKFTGGSSMDLDGILYFPGQEVHFSGGSEADSAELFMVARIVDFTGNAYIANYDPTSSRAFNPLFIQTSLVE